MNADKRIESGISIRKAQVRRWLDSKKFKGEYLLVSTKPDSIYSKKLSSLRTGQKLIVDLYTPILLEKELSLSHWKPQDWLTRFRNKAMVGKFLRRGNHFLVANRRQREYWLETSKSFEAQIKKEDISVFPTGSESKLSTIDYRLPITDCNVLLWFGGIYPWMDPEPLIRVFALEAGRYPDWKLRIVGGLHPETGYKNRFIKLKEWAKEKIPARQLEFVPWQPVGKLRQYLTDAVLAVHLTKTTKEDYFSHRVRLLTLLSAGVPVLTSGRDVISKLLVQLQAGAHISRQQDLERLLIKAINEPKTRKKWSKNALEVESVFLNQERDIRL